MTPDEKRKLNYGTTQSNSDSRRRNGANGYSHTFISNNRVKIGPSIYTGFPAANAAKKKNS